MNTVGTRVVDVLTLTRLIMSMVTGQVQVPLEWKNTPGKKKWYTYYIMAEGSRASAIAWEGPEPLKNERPYILAPV